jgi:Tol biopolymer transport system component
VKRFLALCLVAAAAASLARAGSASAPGVGPRILLLEGGDLYSIAPDGSDRIRLTSDGRVSSPVASPNGQRIAFLKSDGSRPRDLYVMNADGTGGARLIASHPETTNAGGIGGITWSPDSRRLAYFIRFGNPPIRIVDATEGTPFALPQVQEPNPFGSLEWSPDGTELLYDDLGDIVIKPLDGGPARRVVNLTGSDSHASWSPDGSSIAFIHAQVLNQADGGVYAIRRDGSQLRQVAATGTAQIGRVRWKPDGTAVVFDATVVDAVGPRNIPLTTTRTLFAGADGATIGVLRDHVADPMPSPDNAHILLGRALTAFPPGDEAIKPGVYAMNADGSCLTLITTGTAVGWQPSPGIASGPRRECVDIVVSATAPRATGLRGVPISIAFRNEGTLPATGIGVRLAVDRNVRFILGAMAKRCSANRSTATCLIDRLEPGQAFSAGIWVRPPAPAPLRATVRVLPAERDSDPASNEIVVGARVYECWISGSDFSERLQGTHASERICGRAGNDEIDALAGNDVVDGGWGLDTLYGGSGRDRLIGGRGNDTIHARDGERDVIECGWGVDRAFVDRADRVLRGCEVVHRR